MRGDDGRSVVAFAGDFDGDRCVLIGEPGGSASGLAGTVRVGLLNGGDSAGAEQLAQLRSTASERVRAASWAKYDPSITSAAPTSRISEIAMIAAKPRRLAEN